MQCGNIFYDVKFLRFRGDFFLLLCEIVSLKLQIRVKIIFIFRSIKSLFVIADCDGQFESQSELKDSAFYWHFIFT